jgi:hypothetical protein
MLHAFWLSLPLWGVITIMNMVEASNYRQGRSSIKPPKPKKVCKPIDFAGIMRGAAILSLVTLLVAVSLPLVDRLTGL